MSMLVRYRKKGGFQQLLTLIETCSPQKREQLLKVIQTEDPGWAALIKAKMLTIERILSWPPQHLAEVTNEVPPQTLAIVLKSVDKTLADKTITTLATPRQVQILGFLKEIEPNAGELEAARIKVLTKVRELERDLKLDLGRIDPSLAGTDDARVA